MNDAEIISDEFLQAITANIVNGQSVLIAYKLGLFDCLATVPQSISELLVSLNLSTRSVQVLVSCSCALGLVCFQRDLYSLTELGELYLNRNSEFFYGPVFDLLIDNANIMSFDLMEKSFCQDRAIVADGNDIFSNTDGIANQYKFIEALHQKSLASAITWPKRLDLSNCSRFIDIGGGSGVHTIGACLNYKDLEGMVCDRAKVLKHTDYYINKYNLSNRIKTQKLDLFGSHSFPRGDVHFYGDIFHDWSYEKCAKFAKKSYDSLLDGGMIILHEMLFDQDKAGPPLTSAYNLKMLLWTEGQQFSFEELSNILTTAGFHSIKHFSSLGNWSIICGYKN